MNADSNKVLIRLKDKSESGEPVVLAGQTSASIEMTNDVREYTSKTTVDENGVPVRKYLPTRFGATISLESLYDPSGDLGMEDIWKICYNQKKVEFALGTGEIGSTVIKGEGFLTSTSGSFSQDETASGSYSIQIDGGIKFETVS